MEEQLRHLVIGAGQIGRRLADRLTASGSVVTLASRTGAPGVTPVDARDPASLAEVTAAADVIYLTTNPSGYHRWADEWPPTMESVLVAAKGKDLVMMGNFYAYGKATMPMTEHSPYHPADPKGQIRLDIWNMALDAHKRGDLRVVEVRASDYFGPAIGQTSMLGSRFFDPILKGGTGRIIGSLDQPHSRAYIDDIVTTLVAAGSYEGDWGRPWHVPSSTTRTINEIVTDLRTDHGATGKVSAMPGWMLGAVAMVNPTFRAIKDSSYQFTAPFVSDATETSELLGVSATPWAEALARTVAGYREN